MVAQVASAGVLITNQVRAVKGVGVRLNYGTPPGFVTSYDKPAMRCDSAGQAGKSWLAWDLSGDWALYGQTNLVNSSFTIWSENGTSRNFKVVALQNSLGLDGWDQTTLHWSNAPANTAVNLDSELDPGSTIARQQLDWAKIYNGTNLWEANGGGVNLARADLGANFDQCARYTSPSGAVNSNLTAFLKTDTDGVVTLIGVGGSSQNWWVGTNGYYTNDIALGYTSIFPETLGQQIRDTPTLTLVFDVRVALTGGGIACPGGSGVDVSLGGTDVGYEYQLYTNGVYAGLTVVGTGSSVSFGLQNVATTYTAVESNITTTVTRLLPGSAVIAYYGPPGISIQPTSFTAATNAVAYFSLSATNSGGGLAYQWYRNDIPLANDGHYSGTTSSQLFINPVLASDAATSANGYYCRIQNSCGDTLFSPTNALTIQAARNLVWRGTPSNTWDIATTPNWFNSGTSADDVFNQGDNVLLDDTALNTSVLLSSPFLSPGTITFNASGTMGIGAGLLANLFGPNSSLVVNGPTALSQLVISNANSFAGGTTINDGWLVLRNISAAGSGMIEMTGTGLSLLQTTATGGANAGYPGINVLADCIVQVDGNGTYAGSFVGPIIGTAGKKLTLQKPAGVTGDNIRFWNTNFTCNVNIELNIGAANFATYNDIGLQTYNGVFSGSGVLFTRQGGWIILNGANLYTGGTRLSAGTTGIGIDSVGVDYGTTSGALGTGLITIEGNISLFASGGARTLGNPVVYTASGGTLTFTDTNLLTMAGSFDLGSGGIASAVNRTISVAAGATGVLSGTIADNSGLGCGLIKSGNGTVWLNGVNTYAGTITVNAGALGGTGTIAGPVLVNAGGSLAPGESIGTLTVNNSLTINGNLAIEVNKSLPQSNDVVQVSGALAGAAGGKVTVSNLGAALSVGDRFVLFPGQTMAGGSALTVSGAGVAWTNKLEVDGSIEVVSVIPTTPTQLISSISGGTLNLSWPATHIGWSLQQQVNPLNVGLSTNWVTLPGYEAVNNASIAINPASPTVFYRLFYVAP
jgi:autotransporter-associated beta strand protein